MLHYVVLLCELPRLAPAVQARRRPLAVALKQMVQIQRWQRQQIAIVLDIANQPVLYLHHAKDEWERMLQAEGQDAVMRVFPEVQKRSGEN
jgi:hypothetical protein